MGTLGKAYHAMYLIHMPVLEIFLQGAGRIYFSVHLVGVRVPGRFVRDGLGAVVLYLFAELPFHNLVMLLRAACNSGTSRRRRRRRPRRARRPLTKPVSPASEVEVN